MTLFPHLRLQTRGSIPLLWSQTPNIKYKPTPTIHTSPTTVSCVPVCNRRVWCPLSYQFNPFPPLPPSLPPPLSPSHSSHSLRLLPPSISPSLLPSLPPSLPLSLSPSLIMMRGGLMQSLAVQRHLDEQIALYGRQVLVNLVSVHVQA